jgi:FkbM family methyltransferase
VEITGMPNALELLIEIVQGQLGDKQSIVNYDISLAASKLMVDREGLGERSLAWFCDSYLKCFKNFYYDHRLNGEGWLASMLPQIGARMIFDVGANVGEWVALVGGHCPAAAIHAFEIVPQTADQLQQAVAGRPVIVNRFGLSDHDGQIEMNSFTKSSQLASMFPYPHGDSEKIACAVMRGDTYVERNRIEHIDVLKIDTEGAESLVMTGFGDYLNDEFVSLIQFEYGKASILSHVLLYDYYRILGERGFALGKLYPNHVKFKEYDFEDEDFLGPNYIAVSKKRPDIIKAIAL